MKPGNASPEGTPAVGLYRSEFEHDACGVAMVVHPRGTKSHAIVRDALGVLARLEHRGGTGADPDSGDGAGILLQIPHAFFVAEVARLGVVLPNEGRYAVGMTFMPRDPTARADCERTIASAVEAFGLRVLVWRDVPTNLDACGPSVRATAPVVRQFFLVPSDERRADDALENTLYVVRRRLERALRSRHPEFYVCTLSSRTIVYKGLFRADRVAAFYPDLSDERLETAIALVHQRFSTNTFPAWERAHPFRFVAHNGEINALRGNVNAMRARESLLASDRFGESIRELTPVIDPAGSDSAMFDNALELLVRGGRALPHVLAMMVPEAWENDVSMDPSVRDFYAYHAPRMEPWDGPAALLATDGVLAAAALDRNGLRPLRVVRLRDERILVASEVGALDVAPGDVVSTDRLGPGQMLLVDTERGLVQTDDEVKRSLAALAPWRERIEAEQVVRSTSSARPVLAANDAGAIERWQRMHGCTREDLRAVLAPMAAHGEEAIGSMGNDAALPVVSPRPQLLFQYFRQLFAQVTNPPIDPIRERHVLSLTTYLGAEGNLLDEAPRSARHLVLEHPVLTTAEFDTVASLAEPGLRSATLQARFVASGGGEALESALDALCAAARSAVAEGATVLIVSDRNADAVHAPIPSLLALGAVHQDLIRAGLRGRTSLVVDSGDAREVMHVCLLLGYGASAVHPRVACHTVASIAAEGWIEDREPSRAVEKYLHALHKGLSKVMCKMGISTLRSYRGAQVFESLGLTRAVVDRYFTGTTTRLEAIGLESIARACEFRHRSAFASTEQPLDVGGAYQWRREGEPHAYDPDAIAKLQHAVRSANYALFKKYSAYVDAESRRALTLRGLLDLVPGQPVPLDEVEPAREIVKRFKTGAMSFGSISREAHETLAIAMNRLGARSNSGEGGEEPERFVAGPDGDSRRSEIKQVASGRFGVTSHYLVNASELQIKMAQGAKPGEGGQLPGHKVDATIARVRHATEGVGLISPPPHHDIYSIEDLAQLIFDLKNANDRARVSVKLVAEAGVGTVAAGVAKAGADVILISGDSGGTGAAPLSSIKHAGAPWELGLAETQQVLVMNGLRSRVRLETDGQLKTGRDVAVAALLGAEEFGFATAALVASGCVMMRVCHLNTCPVGIATQDPELRKRFAGEPEHIINFMVFVAEELREIMASLGFRTVDEMVGRVDRLAPRDRAAEVQLDPQRPWMASHVDLDAMLARPPAGAVIRGTDPIRRAFDDTLDARLIELATPSLERGERVAIDTGIRNTDRSVCTRLSAEISRRRGAAGLPKKTIAIRLRGTAGQSLGAFMAPGLDVLLEGEANDYVGKGMSGGRLTIVPPRGASFVAEENVIVGNVVLYGATGGELFVRGRAGERFAVRNSGATAVVEGVGDHGCEYMTGGTVIVLGATGRNFAAGMTGGVAYVLDDDGRFMERCDRGTVDLEVLDDDDLAQLREWVQRHVERTGSGVGWRVLAGWREAGGRFVKVMPREFKKALARRDEPQRVRMPVLA